MDAMLIQESRYNPLALSPKGAFGLGQLMPGTAVQLGVDRYDLRGNLAGAARYLRQHIDEFRQVPLALAAYNAGPGRVRKSRSIPRISETQNYVRQILINWRTLEFEVAREAKARNSAIMP
jgi:soluble lytic murein transglycosylase-like protein